MILLPSQSAPLSNPVLPTLPPKHIQVHPFPARSSATTEFKPSVTSRLASCKTLLLVSLHLVLCLRSPLAEQTVSLFKMYPWSHHTGNSWMSLHDVRMKPIVPVWPLGSDARLLSHRLRPLCSPFPLLQMPWLSLSLRSAMPAPSSGLGTAGPAP